MWKKSPQFFDEVNDISPPAKNNKKNLWWNEATLNKQEMRILQNEKLNGEND